MSVDPLTVRDYDGLGFGAGHGPNGKSGAEVVRALQVDHNTVDDQTHTRGAFFNDPILKGTALAPVPGTANAEAMGQHGQINVPFDLTLRFVHLHQIKDGQTGSTTLELYRLRNSVMTIIANVTVASGGGDFQTCSFTFVSEALKAIKAGDYLFLQATAVMGAAGRPAGFVDMHSGPVV